jgi:hypothetical protein
MREAGTPSTGEVEGCFLRSVPAPPGVVMLAPPEIPRNAQPGKVRPRRLSIRNGGAASNNEEGAGSLGEGTRPYPRALLYAKALLGA